MRPKINSVKLRAMNDRNESCYFCGTNASVKYDAEFTEDGVDKVTPCCNACALFSYGLNNTDRNGAEIN